MTLDSLVSSTASSSTRTLQDEPPSDLEQTEQTEEVERDEDTCAICLGPIDNRAVVLECEHSDYCLKCIWSWSQLSRRCPLCNQAIKVILSHVKSPTDYQTHHLFPLPDLTEQQDLQSTTRPFSEAAIRQQLNNRHTHPRFRHGHAVWRHQGRLDQVDEAAVQLQRRKFVYHHKLYAKHVGANASTRYKAPPNPSQFSKSEQLRARVTRFVRRELLCFPNVDVEFLVSYVGSIMQQLDIKSDGAIRLLQEFLGDQAEHFVHEVYSFIRSPFEDPRKWDQYAVYDRPTCLVPTKVNRPPTRHHDHQQRRSEPSHSSESHHPRSDRSDRKRRSSVAIRPRPEEGAKSDERRPQSERIPSPTIDPPSIGNHNPTPHDPISTTFSDTATDTIITETETEKHNKKRPDKSPFDLLRGHLGMPSLSRSDTRADTTTDTETEAQTETRDDRQAKLLVKIAQAQAEQQKRQLLQAKLRHEQESLLTTSTSADKDKEIGSDDAGHAREEALRQQVMARFRLRAQRPSSQSS